MRKFVLLLFLFLAFPWSGKTCTIVVISGRVTEDGRPLLMKNHDSNSSNIRINIGQGSCYSYICLSTINNNGALCGYNNVGFSIASSYSYNAPNNTAGWNAHIMGLALGRCASVDEFEMFLDSLHKPIEVRANYVVIDANGGASVFEVSSYTFTRFDADSTPEGYLVRANFIFSQDMSNIDSLYPSSVSRCTIATNYLNEALQDNGFIAIENLFELSRCLVNSSGEDMRDVAPINYESILPTTFSRLIPSYLSTSSMIVQGVLPAETANLTTAWTMVGPPLSTVTIPFWMTSDRTFPQKSVIGSDGYSWLSHQGQLLKNTIFINSTTIDLAKLYSLSSTGIMQKIGRIEEDILRLGEELLEGMRRNGFSDDEVAAYYAWVDDYLESQYSHYFYNGTPTNAIDGAVDETMAQETEYYDLLGRRLRNVPDNAMIKKTGNKAIILN